MYPNKREKGIYKIVHAFLPWFILGILLLLMVTFTGRGIPCIFYSVTGYYCPGCGMTRAVISLFQGHFAQAFSYNAMLFFVGPFLILIGLRWSYFTIKQKDYTLNKFECIIATIVLILLLVFGIVRNIPIFSVLSPS